MSSIEGHSGNRWLGAHVTVPLSLDLEPVSSSPWASSLPSVREAQLIARPDDRLGLGKPGMFYLKILEAQMEKGKESKKKRKTRVIHLCFYFFSDALSPVKCCSAASKPDTEGLLNISHHRWQ